MKELLIALAALLVSTSAMSAPVKYEFSFDPTGAATYGDTTILDSLNAQTEANIHGSFIYDSEKVAYFDQYSTQNGLEAMQMSAWGVTFNFENSPTPSSIQRCENCSGFGYHFGDQIELLNSTNPENSFAQLNGIDITFVGVNFFGDANWFTNNNVPTDLTFNGSGGIHLTNFGYLVNGTLIVNKVTEVPLPATAWLFCTALAGLAASRRKN